MSAIKRDTDLERIFKNRKVCPWFWINSGVGKGWEPTIEKMASDVEALVGGWVQWNQIKEKFGILRVYTSPLIAEEAGKPESEAPTQEAWDKAYDTISKAEDASEKICENCGNPGSADTRHSWFLTLCEECKKDRK